MRAILDTSVLIDGRSLPAEIEAAISVVSISELHFGVLVATDLDTRAARVGRLGRIESRFPSPLPVDDRVARTWGGLKSAVARRGGQPRRRTADLAIAATAIVHEATLFTADRTDFKIVEDLVEIRAI